MYLDFALILQMARTKIQFNRPRVLCVFFSPSHSSYIQNFTFFFSFKMAIRCEKWRLHRVYNRIVRLDEIDSAVRLTVIVLGAEIYTCICNATQLYYIRSRTPANIKFMVEKFNIENVKLRCINAHNFISLNYYYSPFDFYTFVISRRMLNDKTFVTILRKKIAITTSTYNRYTKLRGAKKLKWIFTTISDTLKIIFSHFGEFVSQLLRIITIIIPGMCRLLVRCTSHYPTYAYFAKILPPHVCFVYHIILFSWLKTHVEKKFVIKRRLKFIHRVPTHATFIKMIRPSARYERDYRILWQPCNL